MSRDGWLPPGVTDRDIDEAAQGGEQGYQCDCCGRIVPESDIHFIPAPNNSGCDTYACSECCGREDEE